MENKDQGVVSGVYVALGYEGLSNAGVIKIPAFEPCTKGRGKKKRNGLEK